MSAPEGKQSSHSSIPFFLLLMPALRTRPFTFLFPLQSSVEYGYALCLRHATITMVGISPSTPLPPWRSPSLLFFFSLPHFHLSAKYYSPPLFTNIFFPLAFSFSFLLFSGVSHRIKKAGLSFSHYSISLPCPHHHSLPRKGQAKKTYISIIFSLPSFVCLCSFVWL